MNHLSNRYGSADSISYITQRVWNTHYDLETGKRQERLDTAFWIYHFHDNESEIQLRRDRIDKPNKYIPFIHYHVAEIHQMVANYEKELASFIEARRKLLTTKDIVSVPIEVREYDRDRNGQPGHILALTADINNSQGKMVAIEENRPIIGVKGRIVIKDNFGDSIYSFPDFKIDLEEELKVACSPGLQFLFYDPSVTVYRETLRTLTLDLDHPETPRKIKLEIADGNKLRASFVPEAIHFSDGTVLR